MLCTTSGRAVRGIITIFLQKPVTNFDTGKSQRTLAAVVPTAPAPEKLDVEIDRRIGEMGITVGMQHTRDEASDLVLVA
jgi:hypothetical protein